jgi:hypothetical protein
MATLSRGESDAIWSVVFSTFESARAAASTARPSGAGTTRGARTRSYSGGRSGNDDGSVVRPTVVLAFSPRDRGDLIVDIVGVDDGFTEGFEIESGVSRVAIDELVSEKDAAALFGLEEFVAIERELDIVVADKHVVERCLYRVSGFPNEIPDEIFIRLFDVFPERKAGDRNDNWFILRPFVDDRNTCYATILNGIAAVFNGVAEYFVRVVLPGFEVDLFVRRIVAEQPFE